MFYYFFTLINIKEKTNKEKNYFTLSEISTGIYESLIASWWLAAV